RLAGSGVEQVDGRLIGVDDGRAQHELAKRIAQRRQLRARSARQARQRRARGVHARAGVDALLPVVRDVVHEPADQHVRRKTRGGDTVVNDLGGCRLLHQELAALAHPLAPDLALQEELRRNDVQPLADVLADTNHCLAAGAARAIGLHELIDPRKVRWQCLALGLSFGWALLWRWLRCSLGLQRFQLRFEAGLIRGQRFLEDLALFGVHALGLRAESPRLQSCALEGDLLDLCIAPLDGLRRRITLLALLAAVAVLL